ncbi:MAG: superoxide dismutase [Bacteroidales bacterium]|nr:superoxide dismutase [Bacteroidales bacterium]MBN2819409.1 superoxide dismutase [Bacteroidales bacterium]
MNKRDFIRNGIAGIIGVAIVPSLVKAESISRKASLRIPSISGKFESLSGFLSKKNIKIHYEEIFLGEAGKLKVFLNKDTSAGVKNAKSIFTHAENYSEEQLENAGSFFNHKLFWKSLNSKNCSKPSNRLLNIINHNFGSIEQLKAEFYKKATNNTSGWTWLVLEPDNKLKIVNTENNQNPFFSNIESKKQGFPLFGLDMWEHAYYLDYTYEKERYINSFWNYLDWSFIDKRYLRGQKQI